MALTEAQQINAFMRSNPDLMLYIKDQAAYQRYLKAVDELEWVHTLSVPKLDWSDFLNQPDPEPIEFEAVHTAAAQKKIATFNPNGVYRWLGLLNWKRTRLQKALESAEKNDQAIYEQRCRERESELEQLREKRVMAQRLFAGETEARLEVLAEWLDWSLLQAVGAEIRFEVFEEDGFLDVNVIYPIDQVVPDHDIIKAKNHEIKLKKKGKKAYYALYKAHVLSLMVYVARLVMAGMPDNQCRVNLFDDVGEDEALLIVSLCVHRDQLAQLDLNQDLDAIMTELGANYAFRITKCYKNVSHCPC